jgi:hypothetical protein
MILALDELLNERARLREIIDRIKAVRSNE